jgi:general secretion pathway protein G
MKTTSRKTHGRIHGFTLLEMMLVVMIIGLLLAAAVHFMSPNVDYAREMRVKADIDSISTALKMYQSTNGFLPTTEQGIQALVTRPDGDPKPTEWRQWMDHLPLDPWQNPYIYENPGTHNQNSFDLYSAGANRKPGTGTDIGNWDDSSSGSK